MSRHKVTRAPLLLITLAGSAALAGCSLAVGTSVAQAQPTLTVAVGADALQQNLYRPIRHIIGKVDSDGAMAANVKYERGDADRWYIEGQRYGGDLIQAGVAEHDQSLISDGIRALNWGFAKEASDGSFPGTGDPFHSASLFTEAAARALLLLRDADPVKYADILRQGIPKVHAAAQWLTRPDVQADGQRKNRPYTHRRWVLASALAESGQLTGDSRLTDAARDYARDGISLQEPNGVNPEKGGYDVSYQAYGITQAERYLIADPNSPVRADVLGMIKKGLDWELTRVSYFGGLETAGSSRTGLELAHTGKVKTLDFSAVQQSLVIGTTLTGDSRYAGAANRVTNTRF